MVVLETLRHNLRRYRGRIESDIGAAPTDVRPEAARGSQFCGGGIFRKRLPFRTGTCESNSFVKNYGIGADEMTVA
jgi:hypothetical protein